MKCASTAFAGKFFRLILLCFLLFGETGIIVKSSADECEPGDTMDASVTFHNVSTCQMILRADENGVYYGPGDMMDPGTSYVNCIPASDLGSGVSYECFTGDLVFGTCSPRGAVIYGGGSAEMYAWNATCNDFGLGFGPCDDDSDGPLNWVGGGPWNPNFYDDGPTGSGSGPSPDGGPSGSGDRPSGSGGGAGSGGGSTAPPCGMPVWRVSEPFISLWLYDQPLGYQPSIGSRIALDLGYKQRESSAGMTPSIFSFGRKWDSSWLSYITVDYLGSNVVHFPGGVTRTFEGPTDYLTSTRLTGSCATGYTLYYPDGSVDTYNCIVSYVSVSNTVFLTQHLNPQMQSTTFNYLTNGVVVQLQSIIDGSGQATHLYYSTNNAYSTNFITKVTDPYFRSAFFSYDTNGCLTGIVDVQGLSNYCSYDTNFWVTQLRTLYGPTAFGITDTSPTNAPPLGRSILVTDPDGSSELYLCQNQAAGVPSSYASSDIPNTGSIGNNFDTNYLNVRNTFHWGKMQYANLTTTNILGLTNSDFRLARMNHWLLTSDDRFGQTLSMQRDPSPDAAGTMEGQKTWYDYFGKTNTAYEGTQSEPLIVGRVLPDGSTAFSWTQRNGIGNVTTNINTFGIGVSPSLRTTILTYGTNQIDLLTVTNALNVQVTSNNFNPYHEILTNYDASNEPTIYTYDSNQRMSGVTLPTGLVITNFYGSDGFLSQQIEIGIATNSYTYANALVQTHTTPLGLTTVNTWDNLQRLTGKTFPDETYISNQYTRLDLTATKDRLGNWTYFGYDQLRHNTSVTNALTNYTLFTYCPCGALEQVRDALGNTNYYGHNNQARLINALYPDGYSVTYNYDLLGRVTNITDSGGANVTNWFNNEGFTFASSNVFGRLFSRSFDALDRVTSGVNINGVTNVVVYDNLNRTISRTHPDSGVETFGYSARGLIAYTNQLSKWTHYLYDAARRKIAETNTLGFFTLYAHDGAGNLTSLTDQNTNTTQWSYDLYGRMTKKVDATNATILTNGYDADNRLISRWTPEKGSTTYAYDSVGNLTHVTNPVSPVLSFAYDAMNRLGTMSDGIGTTSFTYTTAGQLASETGPWAGDTTKYRFFRKVGVWNKELVA